MEIHITLEIGLTNIPCDYLSSAYKTFRIDTLYDSLPHAQRACTACHVMARTPGRILPGVGSRLYVDL